MRFYNEMSPHLGSVTEEVAFSMEVLSTRPEKEVGTAR